MVVNFYLRYLFNNRWIEKPKDLRNSLWPRLHRSTTTQVDSKQSRLGISDQHVSMFVSVNFTSVNFRAGYICMGIILIILSFVRY